LTRVSIYLCEKFLAKRLDCRAIPDQVGDSRPAMATQDDAAIDISLLQRHTRKLPSQQKAF
jgi:hypothetical protein